MVKGMVGEKDNAETLRTQRSAEESEKNTGAASIGAVSSFRVLRKWCHDPSTASRKRRDVFGRDDSGGKWSGRR